LVRSKKYSHPFPRVLSGVDQDRFWRKLLEDVHNCGGRMPNTTEFKRKFSKVMYNSRKDALENYEGFKDALCRGEEYELPEKFTNMALGKSLEDEIVIVTRRLFSNKKNCLVDPIIKEVQKVRGERPSLEIVKNSLKKAWRQHKGDIRENEEELSHYCLTNITKEILEKIIGESLPEYT